MIELHLIGYTADLGHLVLDLEASGGGRYRLIVDGDLFATVDDLREQRFEAGLDVGLWEPIEWLEVDQDDDVVHLSEVEEPEPVAAPAEDTPGGEVGAETVAVEGASDDEASGDAVAGDEALGDQASDDDLLADVVDEPSLQADHRTEWAGHPRVRILPSSETSDPDEAVEQAPASAADERRAATRLPEEPPGDHDERPVASPLDAGASRSEEDAEREVAADLEPEAAPDAEPEVVADPEPEAARDAGPATESPVVAAEATIDEDADLDALITRVTDADEPSDEGIATAESASPTPQSPPPARPTAEPSPEAAPEPAPPPAPGRRSSRSASRPAGSMPPVPARPRTAGGVPVPDEARLSPKQIQGMLRSGKSVRKVAAAAGTDEAWVQRWLEPIEAEQQRVVDEARRLGVTVDRRVCEVPLGDAVEHHLSRMGADRITWSATRRDDRPWRVTVRYVDAGRSRTASWSVDRSTREVRPASAAARELGWLEPSAARR